MRGSGLIAVNPPWTLHDELKMLLPALAEALSRGAAGASRLDWLTGEIRALTAVRLLPPGRHWSTLRALALTFRLHWGVGGVTEASGG